MSSTLLYPLISCLSVILLIPLGHKIAIKHGIVDNPGGRKQHDEPVPPIGGIIIFSVLTVALSIMQITTGMDVPAALFASLGIIVIVGLIDDIHTLDARLKFLTHFAVAAILVIWGGARIESLGNLLGFGTIFLGWLSIPFSIACVVYIINAINMMDGLDGLAGGNAVIISLWFALGAWQGGDITALAHISIFIAVLMGFLVFNARSPWRSHAKIFLGDAGSMGIGLMIAWFAMTLSQSSGHVMEPVSVAWIIALPIIDAFGLLAARLKDKKPPFAPDRRHFHHHFINAGFGVGKSVSLILLWSACLGGIGVFGAKTGLPAYILGWGWVALWLCHTWLTIHNEKFITRLSKLARPRID